jgi:hypothetical protein
VRRHLIDYPASATNSPSRHLIQSGTFPSRPPHSRPPANVDVLSKELEARKELLEALVNDKSDTAV